MVEDCGEDNGEKRLDETDLGKYARLDFPKVLDSISPKTVTRRVARIVMSD